MLHRTSIANLIAQTQTEELKRIGQSLGSARFFQLASCTAVRVVRCGCALTSLLETYGQTLAICDSFLRSSPKIKGLETMHHAPAQHRMALCDQHPAASSSAMTAQQAAASKQLGHVTYQSEYETRPQPASPQGYLLAACLQNGITTYTRMAL
eukprot:COSAG06_NODE_12531_length_1368_cov_1.320725_3_plen_153_part_00